MIQYHYDIEQGTEPWHQIRLGRVGGGSCSPFLTGSGIDPDRECCPNCNSVNLRYRKSFADYSCGKCSEIITKPIKYGDSPQYLSLPDGVWTLIDKNAAEIHTGYEVEGYSSHAMERGLEMEPALVRAYEDRTFQKTTQVGYVSRGRFLGCSPDRLVADDGMIEGKCPEQTEYARYYRTREIQPKYIAQMQWGLWITGRKWCDFVTYHPDFATPLIIDRIKPDPAMQARFDRIVPVYEKELEKALESLAAPVAI